MTEGRTASSRYGLVRGAVEQLEQVCCQLGTMGCEHICRLLGQTRMFQQLVNRWMTSWRRCCIVVNGKAHQGGLYTPTTTCAFYY